MCKINYQVYSVAAVANSILEIGKEMGQDITNLKLQKLVYFAQGWSLALQEHPLFEEEIQAWTYGPVIPELYRVAKVYENKPINGCLSARDRIPRGSEEWNVIEEMMKALVEYTPMQLVKLSHEPQSPWAAAWEKGKYTRISLWQMALYFRDRLMPVNS